MNSIKEIIDTYWYLNWYSLVSEQIYKILPKCTNSNVFLGKFAYTHNGSSEMYGNFLSIKTFLRLSLYMQVTAHQKYIATS